MREAGDTSRRFLVEIVRAQISRAEHIGSAAREAALTLRRRGLAVRFLRTVVVPEDGACYQLWEAESREALLHALRLAGHEPVEISEAITAAWRTPGNQVGEP